MKACVRNPGSPGDALKWIAEFIIGIIFGVLFYFPEYVSTILLPYEINILKIGVLFFFAVFCFYFLTDFSDEISRIKNNAVFFTAYLCFFLFCVIATAVSEGDVKDQVLCFVVCTANCGIFYIALTRKRNGMLQGLLCYFEAMLLTTLVLQIIHPEGLYNLGLTRAYGFLGHVNVNIRILFPGLLLSIVCSYRKANSLRLRAALYLVLLTGLILISRSVAASISICTTVILLVIVMLPNSKAGKFVSCKRIYIFSFIAFCLAIAATFSDSFQSVFTEILNRDVTFTGRTTIWKIAIENISQKPWIGYGNQSPEFYCRMLANGDFCHSSCHNIYLDVALRYGIAGALLFIGLTAIACFLFDKKADKKAGAVLSIALLAIFINAFFECYHEWSIRHFIAPLTILLFASSPADTRGTKLKK